jgi:hypothetical protein
MSKEMGGRDGRVSGVGGARTFVVELCSEMCILSLRTGLRDISLGPIIIQPLDYCIA